MSVPALPAGMLSMRLRRLRGGPGLEAGFDAMRRESAIDSGSLPRARHVAVSRAIARS